MPQSQQIQCSACGNADSSRYSLKKIEGQLFIICRQCNAQTLIAQPPENVRRQEAEFNNAENLLNMREYERAKTVFNDLCTRYSTDPRSWYGYSRALSCDLWCNEENALKVMKTACSLSEDAPELKLLCYKAKEILETRIALREAESQKQKKDNEKKDTLDWIDDQKKSICKWEAACAKAKESYLKAKKDYEQETNRQLRCRFIAVFAYPVGLLPILCFLIDPHGLMETWVFRSFLTLIKAPETADMLISVIALIIFSILFMSLGLYCGELARTNRGPLYSIVEKQREDADFQLNSLKSLKQKLLQAETKIEPLEKEIESLAHQIEQLNRKLTKQ